MKKVGLFCSDSSCSLECVSCIQKQLENLKVDIDVHFYEQCSLDDALKYDTLIFGFDSLVEEKREMHGFFSLIDLYTLNGKAVSFFGNSQKEAMKESLNFGTYLRNKLYERGAKTITSWALRDEDFNASFGYANGEFQGLMLQKECEGREALIGRWCNNIRTHMSA